MAVDRNELLLIAYHTGYHPNLSHFLIWWGEGADDVLDLFAPGWDDNVYNSHPMPDLEPIFTETLKSYAYNFAFNLVTD